MPKAIKLTYAEAKMNAAKAYLAGKLTAQNGELCVYSANGSVCAIGASFSPSKRTALRKADLNDRDILVLLDRNHVDIPKKDIQKISTLQSRHDAWGRRTPKVYTKQEINEAKDKFLSLIKNELALLRKQAKENT